MEDSGNRVVDELNAAASAWGCIIVPPSTANAALNELDGNPWGLSFVLDHGALPACGAVQDALAIHMARFVNVTAAMLPLIGSRSDSGSASLMEETEELHAPRHNIADVLGKE